jgi:hypothetical protein
VQDEPRPTLDGWRLSLPRRAARDSQKDDLLHHFFPQDEFRRDAQQHLYSRQEPELALPSVKSSEGDTELRQL